MIVPCVKEGIWWLGETKGFWVQTGALIISAVGALWLIHSTERSEKQRATIDLTLQQENTPELMSAQAFITNLHRKGEKNFPRFLADRNSHGYKQILRVLNNYEFIAAAVRKGALDEDIYKRMQRTLLLQDWDALRGFITQLQLVDNQPTLFAEWAWLAQRWKKKTLLSRILGFFRD
jgi:hypothetical protein